MTSVVEKRSSSEKDSSAPSAPAPTEDDPGAAAAEDETQADAEDTSAESAPVLAVESEAPPLVLPARVSLTTVALAVIHRQRGTGIVEFEQAMIAAGAKGVVPDGVPDDGDDQAIADLRKKFKMGPGGVDGVFLARLGLDVTD